MHPTEIQLILNLFLFSVESHDNFVFNKQRVKQRASYLSSTSSARIWNFHTTERWSNSSFEIVWESWWCCPATEWRMYVNRIVLMFFIRLFCYSSLQCTWTIISFLFSVKNHRGSKTDSIGNILIPQINFDLKTNIIQSIEEKSLTEQQVSLAPSISYE